MLLLDTLPLWRLNRCQTLLLLLRLLDTRPLGRLHRWPTPLILRLLDTQPLWRLNHTATAASAGHFSIVVSEALTNAAAAAADRGTCITRSTG